MKEFDPAGDNQKVVAARFWFIGFLVAGHYHELHTVTKDPPHL